MRRLEEVLAPGRAWRTAPAEIRLRRGNIVPTGAADLMDGPLDTFLAAVDLLLRVEVFATMLLAACYGLFAGVIPGLTATVAVTLLVPNTFFLDSAPAITAIVTAAAMAIFACDIPGALLRIPGTPASAA
jgi:TctA family transporter